MPHRPARLLLGFLFGMAAFYAIFTWSAPHLTVPARLAWAIGVSALGSLVSVLTIALWRGHG